MDLTKKIRHSLEENRINYRERHHPPASTCDESARARGEEKKIGGKTLMLKDKNGLYHLFVLSADLEADSNRIRKILKSQKVRFATDEELKALVGVEKGALPPFGKDILPFDLYVDRSILENERIAFQPGVTTISFIMDVSDWLRLTRPEICSFARSRESKKENIITPPLRLPRMVESDPRGRQLLHILTTQTRPLWQGSELKIFVTALNHKLTSVLLNAVSAGQVVRSLDNAERTLDDEDKGLRLVDRRSDMPRGMRISRLLLLADDGAERFYRQVERLLSRHGHRVLAVRLDVDAYKLGELLFGPDILVRLLMLDHKEAVCEALLSISDTL
jgi:Ala-tRNA(Pro) deacylase